MYQLLIIRPRRYFLFTVALAALLFADGAKAAVLQSRCRSRPTDLSTGSAAPAPPPLPAEAKYVSSEQIVVKLAQGFADVAGWLGLPAPQSAAENPVALGIAAAGRLDDLRVYLRARANDAWNERECETASYAIQPVVLPFPPGTARDEIRVAYRACAFFKDDQRTILIDGACRTIERAQGYRLKDIDLRFLRIQSTVREFEYVVAGALLLSGGAGSRLIAKRIGGLRAMMAGSATAIVMRTTIAAIPAGAAVAAVAATGLVDRPITGLIEVRDAAKMLAQGKLEDQVWVAPPIEIFEATLSEYLRTIPENDVIVSAK